MNLLGQVNWEMIFISISTVIAVISVFYQAKAIFLRPRARLKMDLEILQLMGKEHEQYIVVKSCIDESINRIYIYPLFSKSQKKGRFRLGAIHAVLCFIFVLCTIYLLHDGWNWWALLTGYIALSFLFNLLIIPSLIFPYKGFDKLKRTN